MQEILSRLQAIEALLKEQTMLKKDVLNFNEACAYLNVSTSHLYKLTSSNRIPHFCPEGKKLYFNRASLDQWLQRNHRDDAAEIEKQAIDFITGKRRTARL